MAHRIAVIGGGILGVTTALTLAQRDCDITIFDERPDLLLGASYSGEGKIHLGLTYPLSHDSTREFMLSGALTFSSLIDSLVGRELDWRGITSPEFINIVMPDSLLSIQQVEGAYETQNELFLKIRDDFGSSYLGRELRSVFEPGIFRHTLTGLPGLRTHERAVNPVALRDVFLDAIHRCSNISIQTNRRVSHVDCEVAAVHTASESQGVHIHTFDAIVNCSWENQAAFMDHPYVSFPNVRYKTSIRIPRDLVRTEDCDTISMVVGPYGDVVQHDEYIYFSWYPLARVGLEEQGVPSDIFQAQVAQALSQPEQIASQLSAFQQLGLLSSIPSTDDPRIRLSGGFILGEGTGDVDDAKSGLHARPDRGIHQEGRVYSPINYKYTTAPLMAQRVTNLIEEKLAQ